MLIESGLFQLRERRGVPISQNAANVLAPRQFAHERPKLRRTSLPFGGGLRLSIGGLLSGRLGCRCAAKSKPTDSTGNA